MTFDQLLSREIIGDISKGRFTREQVKTIFREVYMAGYEAGERFGCEYTTYIDFQTLHYYESYGAKRLKRFAERRDSSLQALDARVFSIEDMRQALKDDAKFDYSMKWEE